MVIKNSEVQVEYDPKDMQFHKLGNAGLRVPVFSLGGWLTFGGTVKEDPVKAIVKLAFENGINMIDLAESYSKRESEREVYVNTTCLDTSRLTCLSGGGRVLAELGIRRSDLIISSKIFFGQADRKGPNDKDFSLSQTVRAVLVVVIVIEGMKEILERLRIDYVGVIFARRPDPTVPMEGVVRAFNHLIDTGRAFYWGISEWSARQVQYNCFHRQRFESEYEYLYEKYGYGTTIRSPLASGILTGKYNNGIPEGSRFATNADFFKAKIEGLSEEEWGLKTLDKVKELTKFAETELGCSMSILALAWAASHPNASTVILGASNPE
ncbi:hypothetical protein FRC11_009540 [Ceratobasidium sp. 423]|nr:hypothetical protein FRC11_009540 [Ceratobasidium sp. 423]